MSLYRSKSALVTGASSGLGEEFARQLAARGVGRLILTSRPDPHLEELHGQLQQAYPALQIIPIPEDLSSKEGVTALIRQLDSLDFPPDILINNAGFGDIGPFQTSKPQVNHAMLGLNVTALTRLTRWVLPGMRQRGEGWICHVGSTSGFLPLVTSAVYGASKAYVNSFSEALRIELRGSGIHVLTLCPGPIHTGFASVAVRPQGKWRFNPPAFFYVDKEQIVRQALDALERRQARLIPGLRVRIPTSLAECIPRWILRLIANLVR